MLSIEAEGAPRLTDNNLQDLHNFLHHAYELVEFDDYFRFVQNISKFLNLTSPWPKTICPFFCKVSECEHVEGFPCRYCSRILNRKWSPTVNDPQNGPLSQYVYPRTHNPSDMCIPYPPTLQTSVLFLLFLWRGLQVFPDYEQHNRQKSNDSRQNNRKALSGEFTSSTSFVGRNHLCKLSFSLLSLSSVIIITCH